MKTTYHPKVQKNSELQARIELTTLQILYTTTTFGSYHSKRLSQNTLKLTISKPKKSFDHPCSLSLDIQSTPPALPGGGMFYNESKSLLALHNTVICYQILTPFDMASCRSGHSQPPPAGWVVLGVS